MAEFAKPTLEQLTNRFAYHAPIPSQIERYARIRKAILDTAVLAVDLTPVSPEQARALNALDEAMFLFNAAIARSGEKMIEGGKRKIVAHPPEPGQ